jgi:hypothetical protein
MKNEIKNLKIQFGIGVLTAVTIIVLVAFGVINFGIVPIIGIGIIVGTLFRIKSNIELQAFMQEIRDAIEECNEEIEKQKLNK